MRNFKIIKERRSYLEGELKEVKYSIAAHSSSPSHKALGKEQSQKEREVTMINLLFFFLKYDGQRPANICIPNGHKYHTIGRFVSCQGIVVTEGKDKLNFSDNIFLANDRHSIDFIRDEVFDSKIIKRIIFILYLEYNDLRLAQNKFDSFCYWLSKSKSLYYDNFYIPAKRSNRFKEAKSIF